MRRVALAVVVLIVAACKKDPEAAPSPSPATENVTKFNVAGASDLSKAFEELGAVYKAKTGVEPVFQFGSSGLLARQIKEGAPVDLYAAANVAFVDDVVTAGKCDPSTKAMYARGHLVMWSKTGGVAPPKDLADLADPRFGSIGIASPDTAPYGKAAKQALEKLGVWAKVEGRIRYGEDIRKTFQFAETGNVDVALVARSLTIGVDGGTTVPVPVDLHEPIDQALVACGTGPRRDAAAAFGAFVGSPEGRAIMKKYGFVLPGEE